MNALKLACISTLLATNLVHAQEAPLTVSPTSEHIQKLMAPVLFTPHGIESFFKERFNQQAYTQHLLHSSFIHMLDFFEFGAANKKPCSFTIDVIEVFHTRLKECLWVNPFALAQLLGQIPNSLHDLCLTDAQITQEAIKKSMYNTLLNKYDALKNDPEKVLSDLAQEIYAIAHPESDADVLELQNGMIRFMESALNKVVWDPRDQIESWNCFKLLGEHIKGVYACMSIANKRPLNQLYWSLIYRYCYFMDTMAPELSLETYAAIKQDIISKEIDWLFVEEAEGLMTSKIEHLTKMIMMCEARARANAEGITV